MKKQKKFKPIPQFASEDEERDFWSNHDATDYFDFSKPTKMDLSKLKPSTEAVTLRMPSWLVYDLKMLANKRDVPYQSLLKVLLAEKVAEEFRKQNR